MGMDSVEEYNSYDEVDADQVFNGGYIGGSSKAGMGGEGRKRGKKSLSRSTARARPKRAMGRGFSFNLRGFEDTAKAMLAVSVGSLVLCGVILFVTKDLSPPFDFYGSLAASLVVMSLLFYTASRLIGR